MKLTTVRPYLNVLLMAFLVAIIIFNLDVAGHIYIALIFSTIIALIFVGLKEKIKKEPE